MADLVSILIPAYNAERWIAETLRSAIHQTWPRKEVIVVDDGSRDQTLTIARTFESRAVKVVGQANSGACAARNHALGLANGDYIQWLDADDVLHPQKIERQLEGAEPGRTSVTLLTCAWAKFFFRTQKARFCADPLWQSLTPVEWILTKFQCNVWMNPAVWLVSRYLTDVAGAWDERLSRSGDDDGEYMCRLVASSGGVTFVPDARCYYRIGNVGGLSWNMGRSEMALESLVLSLRLSIDHLRSLEDSERTRRASLNLLRHFLPYFYAADSQLVESMNALAGQLGGRLAPPSVGWKYYVPEKLVGRRATKSLMNNWRTGKLLARRKWASFCQQIVNE